MQGAPTQARTDIVLVGGGHAHVQVVKRLGMHPLPGVRVTLVARDLETPYSGMLPGLVAGHYGFDDCHIDLQRLCRAVGVRVLHAQAVGLDRQAKRVLLADRPPIAYDLLSLDTGITPRLDEIAGAAEHALVVKPIGAFLAKWERLRAASAAAGGPRRIVVVGGGPAGCELVLSIAYRLRRDAAAAGLDPSAFGFTLLTSERLVAGLNPAARRLVRRALAEAGVALREGTVVVAVDREGAALSGGERMPADAVLVSTRAAPPSWFARTGLDLDPSGFIAVRPTLQSTNDPSVFATGDCAAMLHAPRPKAGVFAVRQGPFLTENLRRAAAGRGLLDYRPQRTWLAMVATGPRHAIASKGHVAVAGAWVWRWKDRIDRRFMRKFQDVEAMRAAMAEQASTPDGADAMRCGGCAAKVGAGPLGQALRRLPPSPGASDVLIGLDRPDDAAVIVDGAGEARIETVDFFPAFIDDPYRFGAVAAMHAMGDVLAMGGRPHHALAIAQVPPGPPAKVTEELFQLLAGARASLDRAGVALVGGHTTEGAPLALGFAVSGRAAPERLLTKGGLQPGDALVLTRPLGTGVLFAADMRALARAPWIAAALAEMERPAGEAASILAAHGARGATDVTGFGLAGHLAEMLAAAGLDAEVALDQVPLYPGARALAELGIASTLLPENLAFADRVAGIETLAAEWRVLLFDPQTAGGLLAGIPAAQAEACRAALVVGPAPFARVVGRVTGPGSGRIALRGPMQASR